MSERSVCVLDMALYKTLYILSHYVLSCVTDCFTVCLSLRFVNVLTIDDYYYYYYFYTVRFFSAEIFRYLPRCLNNIPASILVRSPIRVASAAEPCTMLRRRRRNGGLAADRNMYDPRRARYRPARFRRRALMG